MNGLTEFLQTFFLALIGGGITLIGAYIVIRSENKRTFNKLGVDVLGNITKIMAELENIKDRIEKLENKDLDVNIATVVTDLENVKNRTVQLESRTAENFVPWSHHNESMGRLHDKIEAYKSDTFKYFMEIKNQIIDISVSLKSLSRGSKGEN